MGPPGGREFIVDSLQLISREFDDKLLNYCEFLGVLESAYDFFTYQVEKELAQVLRDEATPIESVVTAQKEMAEIEKMEAYDDYCLCFFDHIREAINFRLADADTYLADLDKQIKHHTYEYKRLVNDENFDQLSSLFRFEELGKLLIKKIEYLRTHGREYEVDAIMEEYKYVPDVCSFKINELLEKGLENDALKEIDKTIAVYGDDGYNTTEPWHLQKIEILEKRNDKASVIEEYRRLFRQFLVDKRPYFEKLKELVAKEDWDEFAVKLFESDSRTCKVDKCEFAIILS